MMRDRGVPQPQMAQRVDTIHPQTQPTPRNVEAASSLRVAYDLGVEMILQEYISQLNLPEHVQVQRHIEGSLGDEFVKKPTIGLFGVMSNQNLALLVGMGHHDDVAVMMIDTGAENNLFSDQHGKIYARNFCTYEDGVIKRTRAVWPVPIDIPIADFGGNDFSDVEGMNSTVRFTTDVLGKMGQDKHETKQILARAGFNVPPGVLIPQAAYGDMTQVEDFLVSYQPEEVFIKPNNASQGDLAASFIHDDLDVMLKHVRAIQEARHDVVVESRIESAPISGIGVDGARTDANIRALIVINGGEVRFIDAEYRFGPRTNGPINVSKGAKAAHVTDTGDRERISSYSIGVGQAMLAYAKSVDPDAEHRAIVGIDIIVADGTAGTYTLEFNSRSPGGFGTITHLEEAPMTSVRDALLPSLRSTLLRRFNVREQHPVLTPITPAAQVIDRGFIEINGMFGLGKTEDVINMSTELQKLNLSPQQRAVALGYQFEAMIIEDKDPDQCFDIALDILDLSSWNVKNLEVIVEVMIGGIQNELAMKLIDEAYCRDVIDKEKVQEMVMLVKAAEEEDKKRKKKKRRWF